jgi:hypothetical protein
MKKLAQLLFVISIICFNQNGFAQLTGEWKDDNGGCYKIRQINNQIFWSMDARPRVVNVFMGYLAGNTITGIWADVPGGEMMGNGTLSLKVESQNRMVKIDQSGNYGANVLLRGPCSQGNLLGTWSWSAVCDGEEGGATWTITVQNPDGSFKGQMNTTGRHKGSLEGRLTGNNFEMTRTIAPGHVQKWTGTMNPLTNTLSGTLSDPFHASCTWTAKKE